MTRAVVVEAPATIASASPVRSINPARKSGLAGCAGVIGAAQHERHRKVLLVQAVGGSDDPLVLALRENHAKLAAPDAAHRRL